MPDAITGVQFFNDQYAQFPIKREHDDLETFVNNLLQAYVNLITNMKPADGITTSIQSQVDLVVRLCEFLKDAIRNYHRGLPHQAYARLHDAIGSVYPDFCRCIATSVSHHPFLFELYRMRIDNEKLGRNFTPHELFHIPFECRHVVKRQRYSIPGLPCLYLGGSLYVCWEELGRPSFDYVSVTRYEVAKGETVNVLDFMQKPSHIARSIEVNPHSVDKPTFVESITSLAVIWPLMALASIQRKHADAPFIAEYIIPQLILQWITEDHAKHHLDGIAYSSVRIGTRINREPALFANLVFPAKNLADKGHCSCLRSKFALTNPLPWHLLDMVNLPSKYPTAADTEVELIPKHMTPYKDTKFCELEGKLRMIPATTF